MIETASLPDTVICIEPDDGDNRILMKRFCETNGLPYPFEKETGEDEATEGNKVSGVMNILSAIIASMCHSSRERLNRLNHYTFKIFVCH